MSGHCPTDCPSCVDARERRDEAQSFEWRDGWCQTVLTETVEERHELRMVTWGNALVEYCPCGWVFSNEYTFGLGENVGLYSVRYREHLGGAANE